MYLQDKHCKRILNELSSLRYKKNLELKDIKMMKGEVTGKQNISMDSPELSTYVPGDVWGEDDEKYLFRASFEVPEDMAGEYLLLMADTSEYGQRDPFNRAAATNTSWNINRNPQFLLYLNNRTVQGFDKFHNYAIVTNKAKTGEKFEIALDGYPGSRLSIGREGRVQLYLKVTVLDRKVENLYYNLKVLYDVAIRCKDEKTKSDLIKFSEKALKLMDLRKPYSKEFYTSVDNANNYLENDFYTDYCGTIGNCKWYRAHTY